MALKFCEDLDVLALGSKYLFDVCYVILRLYARDRYHADSLLDGVVQDLYIVGPQDR